MRLRAALDEAGIETVIQANGAREFLGIAPELEQGQTVAESERCKLGDVSYADDLAFVIAGTAHQIVDLIAKAGTIAWKVYEEAGFSLNFGPKKTAVVITWKGEGQKACRRDLEHRLKNKISIEHFGKISEVDVVQRYKHMGTISTESGGVAPEILTRANAVWGKTRKLRKKLFGASDIGLDVKRGAMQSMMMSSQVFQCGCWPILTSSEYRTCKTAIVKVYKLVCSDAYMVTDGNSHSCDDALPDNIAADTHWRSDDEIVDIAQQLHPAVLLRLQRLCTSIRMAVRAPWEVWKVLYAAKDATSSWVNAVHADIRCFAAASSTFQDLDVSNLAAWLKMAKANPRTTMQAVKKVCATPRAKQLAIALASNTEEQVANGNVTVDSDVFKCEVCGYTFLSKAALKCHQATRHEMYSNLGRCVDTCGCSVCGLTFESIHWCYIHAAKSGICKNN